MHPDQYGGRYRLVPPRPDRRSSAQERETRERETRERETRERETQVSEVTKEDFRELARELREGQEGIRQEIRSLGTALNAHALEDSTREGHALSNLSTMRTKIEALTISADDRHRFTRGWIGGLLAVAVAACLGFLFKTAIAIERSTPSTSAPLSPSSGQR
jgi:hypothetical protein